MANERAGKHTPVMQQFFRAKEQYPDALLFFRMGDFYELFFEDAVEAARLLDLTLTSRSKSADDEPIPMAGVPHHAATGYIARLLELGQQGRDLRADGRPGDGQGHRAARGGARGDARARARPRGARRARAQLPGLAGQRAGPASAWSRSSSRRPSCAAACSTDAASALAELVRLDPRELLIARRCCGAARCADARSCRAACSRAPPRVTQMPWCCASRSGAEAEPRAASAERARACWRPPRRCAYAAGTASRARRSRLGALAPTAPRISSRSTTPRCATSSSCARSAASARARCSRCSTTHCTPMGARSLRRRLLAPLTDVAAIRRRHDAVEALFDDARALRGALREALQGVGDLERLATRAALGVATPRDLGAIRAALRDERRAAQRCSPSRGRARGRRAHARCSRATSCEDLLRRSRRRRSSTSRRSQPRQGGIFRDGPDPRIDELRTLSRRARTCCSRSRSASASAPASQSLKVRYTRVFGYYIEITRSNLGNVPERLSAQADHRQRRALHHRRARRARAQDRERRRALSARSSGAASRRCASASPSSASRLFALARALAELDVHARFAEVAHRYDYVRPSVDDSQSCSTSRSAPSGRRAPGGRGHVRAQRRRCSTLERAGA